jgi:GTP pyrophosphokinase
VPHKDWLKFVRTSRARTKIKHWLKAEQQKRSVEVGRRLLEREFKRQDLPPAQMLKSDRLLEAARKSGFDSLDELAAAVGYGRVAASEVASWLLAPVSAGAPPAAGTPVAERAPAVKDEERGVKVKGGRDLLMQLSRCCNPVPGDRIMGYITRGRGLTIHAVGCPNLDALDYDRDRLVDVEWDFTTPSTHPVKVSIVAVDKPGVLANVSSSISGAEANITRAEIATSENRKAILDFVVEVQDTAHLERVMKAIERVEGVITARRVRAWHE